MNNQCIICGDIIPEGRQVCPKCESTILKIGIVLQTREANKEEVRGAYKKIDEHRKKIRKTISLNEGEYTIVYNESGAYPERILRHNEEWKNVVGDNVIFYLCKEIERLKNKHEQDGQN